MRRLTPKQKLRHLHKFIQPTCDEVKERKMDVTPVGYDDCEIQLEIMTDTKTKAAATSQIYPATL